LRDSLSGFVYYYLLGESIAAENPEIKSDLMDACREARTAGMCNNFSSFLI